VRLLDRANHANSVVKISSHETRKNQLQEAHRRSMAQKFYVVWSGRQTGVFADWATTQRAVTGYTGARFKSFSTRAEAQEAFASGSAASVEPKTPSK
jgi:Caulimovirus viroplasmin